MHVEICLLSYAGLESGTRQPIDVRPQSMLEGRDLPTCDLTKYLQQELDDTLATDAAARAAACGRDVQQARARPASGWCACLSIGMFVLRGTNAAMGAETKAQLLGCCCSCQHWICTTVTLPHEASYMHSNRVEQGVARKGRRCTCLTQPAAGMPCSFTGCCGLSEPPPSPI